MPETVAVRGDNLTVDLLLWRRYGVRGRELVEATLALNTGVSGLGAVLPLGTVLTLPDLPDPAPFTTRKVVTLFG